MLDEKKEVINNLGETLLIGVTGKFFVEKNTFDANEVEEISLGLYHVASIREQFAFKGLYEQHKLFETGLIDSWSI
jgi:hypothetical protein